MGDHLLCCHSTGFKTLQHNKVVDILVFESLKAHAMPFREPCPFSNNNLRADVSFRLPGAGRDAPLVTDVAITHFATKGALISGAAHSPNGAAQDYLLSVKHKKYGNATFIRNTTFAKATFEHCVYDSLGAPTVEAASLIGKIGKAIADSTNRHRSVVIRELHHRLSFCVAQSTARRLHAGAASIMAQLQSNLQRTMQSANANFNTLSNIDDLESEIVDNRASPPPPAKEEEGGHDSMSGLASGLEDGSGGAGGALEA
jgi:hypothetical protein